MAAWSFTWFGRFTMTMEGLNVEISSDPMVMGLGIGLALVLGVLAGVVPAWRVSRREIAHSFRAV